MTQNQSGTSVQETWSLRLHQIRFVYKFFTGKGLYFEATLIPKKASEAGLQRLPSSFGARNGSAPFWRYKEDGYARMAGHLFRYAAEEEARQT
jgi:hypothetical protein